MTRDEFNTYCAALPATTHVVQWGGADVWKVGGKLFAIGGWNNDELGVTFKTGPIGFDMLKDQPGLRPAPYLASRGMMWIQHYAEPGLCDDDLRDYIAQSHKMIAAKLTKKKQAALGLLPDKG